MYITNILTVKYHSWDLESIAAYVFLDIRILCWS